MGSANTSASFLPVTERLWKNLGLSVPLSHGWEREAKLLCSHFFPGESWLFSLDLELYMLGEEVQIKELKTLNEMDGRLLLGLGRFL